MAIFACKHEYSVYLQWFTGSEETKLQTLNVWKKLNMQRLHLSKCHWMILLRRSYQRYDWTYFIFHQTGMIFSKNAKLVCSGDILPWDIPFGAVAGYWKIVSSGVCFRFTVVNFRDSAKLRFTGQWRWLFRETVLQVLAEGLIRHVPVWI